MVNRERSLVPAVVPIAAAQVPARREAEYRGPGPQDRGVSRGRDDFRPTRDESPPVRGELCRGRAF